MTIKQHFFRKIVANDLTRLLVVTFTLSACSTTTPTSESQNTSLDNKIPTQTNSDINTVCQRHAKKIAVHAESVASTAQYLAAANAMHSCVNNALQQRVHNSSQAHQDTIMKMMANSTLSYLKAGDVITARREVERFKRIYPNQDLYFDDYTSFIDTATALLSLEPLAPAQVSVLNISRALRNEIERKHYWLNN